MKKNLKPSISLISSSVILLAVGFTPFAYANISSAYRIKNSSNTYADGMSYAQKMKLVSTWSNDRYETTLGYVYVPPHPNVWATDWKNGALTFDVNKEPTKNFGSWKAPSNKWLLSLDQRGLVINDAVKYNYNNVKYFAFLTKDLPHDTEKRLNSIDMTQEAALDYYEYANGNYQLARKTTDMTFGTWEIDPITKEVFSQTKVFDLGNKAINEVTPYIRLTMPSFVISGNYSKDYNNAKQDVHGVVGYSLTETKMNGFDKNSTAEPIDYAWARKEWIPAPPSYRWKWENRVPPHNYLLTEQHAIGVAVEKREISIFIDYDGNQWKNTHLIASAFDGGIETSYDSLDVGSLQIAGKLASNQVGNVASVLTLNGDNIGYQFMRDGNLQITADDKVGKITVQYTPKSMFDSTGAIVPYSGSPMTKVIEGFEISKTLIKALDSYLTNVIVDKWKEMVTNREGIVTKRADLAKYLDLSTVPTTATLTIQNESYDFKAGTITFNIWSDQLMRPDNSTFNDRSENFRITLNLTPRVTTFIEISQNPEKITVDQLESKLFDPKTGKLNLSEFEKYQSIIAPFESAEYFLVPGSYTVHTGDGTVSFKLYANVYHNSEGYPAAGEATKPSTHFSFNWKLYRTPTVVTEVKDFVSEHRVDRLIDAVTDANGKVTDIATLNKYIDTENLPSDSVLSISKKDGDIVYSNYTATDYRDTVTFKLKATKFNKANNVAANNIITELTLKLLPQHKATDAIVKTLPNNPDRIDIFKNKIETLSGADLITYLKGYIDFTSLRNDANVTAKITSDDFYNGELKLNLGIERYYDDQSEENLAVKNINGLNISLLPLPTTVKVIKPKDTSVRLDRFVKTFADETTGIVNNLAVLQQYVSFDVWNPNTTLRIVTKSMNNATGEWNGDLIMAEANDLDSTRVTNKHFPLQFQFAEKYAPTTIEQLPEYPLVQLDDFRNNLFDEAGFAKSTIYNYFDVYSLPPNGKLKLAEEPVIDYPNAQLTVKVEITSYYDQDSDLQESSPITRNVPRIETFTFDLLSPETRIVVAESYDQTPRVDRFAASIKTLTDDDLKLALADYASFDYLPANTSLSIDQTSMSITNIPGTLKFDVLASRYFDAAGYLQTSTKPFPITLNLANKYTTTNITAKTSAELPADKLRVDRFIAALGASEANPEIINLDTLKRYVNIISIPEHTKLAVDYAQPIDINVKTGSISFSIKVNQYYDADSDLQTKDLSFPISLTVGVVHEPTSITAKTTDLPNTRADRLLKTFMDTATNKVTNFEVLKQYVDITSLPSTATLFVANQNVNAKLGTISFNLIASQYYDLNSDIQTDSVQTAVHPFPISLQLAPKIDATNFTAKTTLPDDVLVNELTEYLAPKGVTNLERFEQYIDVISLPTNTKIELEETSYSTTTGKISYNVKVNQYYDTEGDLQTKPKSYPVVLQLSPVYAETEIYALDNYPTDLDITTFKQYVVDTSDNVVEDNLKKFVGIVSLPPASQLTIAWGTETDTTIDFIVHASQYYNAQHKLANDKDFNISLTFNNNVLPTDIKAWPTYPQTGAHQFFKLVNPNNKIDYTQLSKYLDLSTVPFDATLTIVKPDADQKTGLVTFDITTSTWYDENKVHQTSDRTFSISLNLTPKYAETNLFGIASVEKDITLDAFWSQISTNNKLDQSKLAQYVNLDTLVPNTKLQYLNPVKSWNGGITFDLVVDRYYDADGTENAGKKVFKIVLNNLAVNLDQKQIDDYTWLYVTLALVFSALGSLVWFLIAKNKKRKEATND